jgi:hypothetical protein
VKNLKCPTCKSTGPFIVMLEGPTRLVICFHKPRKEIGRDDEGEILHTYEPEREEN